MISLARASQRASRYLRGLSPADREDVLATAILWCWEHKTDYDPSVALDEWFIGAIRNAKKAWGRQEGRQAAELVDEMQGSDDPLTHVEAIQAVEAVARGFTPAERDIADMVVQGYSQREIRAKLGPMRNDTMAEVRERLDGLRRFMPDFKHVSRIIRHSRTPKAQDTYEAPAAPARIDREIAKLEFAPPSGDECPPCWRCKYFEGYLPTGAPAARLVIAEAEVRLAVARTEARKIEIAKEVRS